MWTEFQNERLFELYPSFKLFVVFSDAQSGLSEDSHKIIGLQSGSNKGASQAGMTPYGATRQIKPDSEGEASVKPLVDRNL